MQTFGEKLKSLRLQSGLTQLELARKLNVEQSYLSYLENDKSTPSLDVFECIAKVFGLSHEELLKDIDKVKLRQSFQHIPAVSKEYLSTPKSNTLPIDRKILFLYSIFLVSVWIFLLGFYSILFANIQYHYLSNEDIPIADYSATKEVIHQFSSSAYLGEFYVEKNFPPERLPRVYQLTQVENRYHVINKLFMIFGVVAVMIITILLLYKKA